MTKTQQRVVIVYAVAAAKMKMLIVCSASNFMGTKCTAAPSFGGFEGQNAICSAAT